MLKAKAAIFDMDGTLLDSMPFWDTVGSRYLQAQGVTPPENLRDKTRALSLQAAAAYLKEEFALSQTTEEIVEGVNQTIRLAYETEIRLKPYVLPFLEGLKRAGISMAVATATDRQIVLPTLARLHINGYFSHVVTCGEVGAGKDRPAVFDRARQLLAADKSETVVFEDALHAIRTAKAAGYYVVALSDDSEAMNKDTIIRIADRYLSTFKEF